MRVTELLKSKVFDEGSAERVRKTFDRAGRPVDAG